MKLFTGQTIGDQHLVKQCCANLYESDLVRLLLGDSFHPGGLELTARLGELLDLQEHHRLLDVAAGRGTSALFLAERFGCEIIGVDYSSESVATANCLAGEVGLADRVRFEKGDAERLAFANNSFDAVICECAFCTFPDKARAAAEFGRVLKPEGLIGLSDLTRSGAGPPELNGLLAWITCIADALPVEEYIEILSRADLVLEKFESHDEALTNLVREIRGKLIGTDMLLKLKKIKLPGIDLGEAKSITRNMEKAVYQGKFGYALFVARR